MKSALAVLLLLPAAVASASPPAVASVGRDLVISRSVPGRVVAVASDVRIDAPVAGDVVIWGGAASFGPGGSVAGNLVEEKELRHQSSASWSDYFFLPLASTSATVECSIWMRRS